MAGYNYRWSPKRQKQKAEKSLAKFIRTTVAKYSPFYREWFKQHAIDPKKIKSIEDIQSIPPVSEKEYLENPLAFILRPNITDWFELESDVETTALTWWQTFNYWRKAQFKTHFRSIFGKEPVREEEEIRIEVANEWLPIHFHKAQNSANPALIAYTKRDLTKIIPEITAQIYMTGFKDDWEIFNLMPATPDINFFQSVWTPLSVGGGTFFSCSEKIIPIEEQIKIASEITFEVLIGTPSYVSKWLKKATEKIKAKEIEPISSIRLCQLTGETLTMSTKQKIKDQFEAVGSSPKILESYANNQAKASFSECSEGSGIHVNPRYFYWEVLDTETLEPAEEGEKGYLCFSHIDWRGTTFIRYNTRDIVEGLEWEACGKCGLTFPIIRSPIVLSDSNSKKKK